MASCDRAGAFRLLPFLSKRAIGDRPDWQQKLWDNGPTWVRRVAAVLVFYALFNFFYFVSTVEGTPQRRDNEYWLTYKGDDIRQITEAEFHLAEAHHIRGGSGHWMIFSFFAFALLNGTQIFLNDETEPKAETADSDPTGTL